MVYAHGQYDCSALPGFAYIEQHNITGIITYTIEANTLRVISLDALQENKGIGSRLLREVERVATTHDNIKHITVTTTNDNIRALHFYQRRGYLFASIGINHVTRSRQQKPSIPYIADNGIPIRDELHLNKDIQKNTH